MDKEIKIVEIKKEYIEAALDIAIKSWMPIRISQKKLLGEELYNFVFDNWQEIKKNAILKKLEEGRGYIALCDGKVAGFTTYSISTETGMGEILENAVSDEFKGRGIAGMMHHKVLSLFKEEGMKFAKVSTGLDEGHAPARRAYEKAGFKVGLPHVTYHMKLDKNTKREVFDDLEIVKYDKKYLKEILDIALNSWTIIHNSYCEHLGKELHDKTHAGWEEKLKAATTRLLEEENSFIALCDNKVAGYAVYRFEKNNTVGVFSYNSVSTDFRGKRISSRLYNAIKLEMIENGCEYARVLTGLDDAHAPARRAYERTGFEHFLPSITYYKEL